MSNTISLDSMSNCLSDSQLYTPLGEFDHENKQKIFWIEESKFNKHFTRLMFLADLNNQKEKYFICGLRNLLKKINFLELFQQLQAGDITEEEFNTELENQSTKYTIELNNQLNPLTYQFITEIISKIGFDVKDLSTSEVSEMFSVQENELIKFGD